MEWLKMNENGWKWVEKPGNGLQSLEMAGHLKMAGMAGNGCNLLEIA